jgi:hypothetical protein
MVRWSQDKDPLPSVISIGGCWNGSGEISIRLREIQGLVCIGGTGPRV